VILLGGTLTLTLGAFVLLIVNAVHFGSSLGFLLRSYGNLTGLAAFEVAAVVETTATVALVLGRVTTRSRRMPAGL